MYFDSSILDSGDAGRETPRSGVPAPLELSRLVIRDESTEGKTLASDERSSGAIDPDYESEIYRLESRGCRRVNIAYPVPLDSANPHLAHIDWCAYTLRPPQFKTHLWVMSELARLFGLDLITPRATGLYGYKHSAIIEDGGLIAWGGKHQKGTVYVSLNAQGCARVTDWATSLAGDWWGGNKGRTVYIGARENGELARIYEKGKQQGDPASAWTRIELETTQ